MTGSDWTAIAGIGGTLLGTIFGALITLFTTRMQIKSRTSEFKTQLEYERKEKQSTKLIEQRTPYLNNIKDQLKSLDSLVFDIHNTLISIELDFRLKLPFHTNPVQFHQDIATFLTSANSISFEIIKSLRTSVSDKKLIVHILNVSSASNSVVNDVQNLTTTISVLGNDEAKFIELYKPINKDMTDFYEMSRIAKQRIEEILSGIE